MHDGQRRDVALAAHVFLVMRARVFFVHLLRVAAVLDHAEQDVPGVAHVGAVQPVQRQRGAGERVAVAEHAILQQQQRQHAAEQPEQQRGRVVAEAEAALECAEDDGAAIQRHNESEDERQPLQAGQGLVFHLLLMGGHGNISFLGEGLWRGGVHSPGHRRSRASAPA